jgi:hypothetical protein
MNKSRASDLITKVDCLTVFGAFKTPSASLFLLEASFVLFVSQGKLTVLSS